MKKLFASVVVLGSLGLTTVTTNASAINPTILQEAKTTVKPEELPATVKTTLSGKEYDGWVISSATQSQGNYVVELKKGEEKKTVTVDKDGKIVG